MRKKLFFSAAIFVAALLFTSVVISGCGSSTELTSIWNNNEVVIDGQANEWGSHTYYLKETHLSLGVRNDDDFLYLCLMSSEGQFRRQIIALGLTVWFEPEGGQKLGIHYPVGMQRRGAAPFSDGENPNLSQDRERIMEQALLDIEVLGSDKNDRQLFTTLDIPGISVKVESSQGAVVYEMKVPIKQTKDHPYALGADVRKVINLSMETGNLPSSSSGEGRRGGGEGRGGRGGRRSRGGEQPEGLPQEGNEQPERSSGGRRLEPLSFFAKIILAHQQAEGVH